MSLSVSIFAAIVSIADFGAKTCDAGKCTQSFAAAIESVHRSGGGTVVVPDGVWLTGPVRLKSNVELHLSDGAVVEFSPNPEDCLPPVRTSFSAIECFNYSPLLHAYGATNVSVTGKGIFRPRMEVWRTWFNRETPEMFAAMGKLYEWGENDIPVEKRILPDLPGARFRPCCIEFEKCRNVLLDGFKVRDSPLWTIHVRLCEDVVARNLDIRGHGNNNDGIDINASRRVLVEDCVFDQGDDAIILKSGRDRDGRRVNVPTEDVTVRRCLVKTGHVLVGIGSEVSGGVRNVEVYDCRSEGAIDNLVFIKTSDRKGAFVENVTVSNVTAVSAGAVVAVKAGIDYQWGKYPARERIVTRISGLRVSGITCMEANEIYSLHGDARLPIRNVTLRDIRVGEVRTGVGMVENVEGFMAENVTVDPLPGTDVFETVRERFRVADLAADVCLEHICATNAFLKFTENMRAKLLQSIGGTERNREAGTAHEIMLPENARQGRVPAVLVIGESSGGDVMRIAKAATGSGFAVLVCEAGCAVSAKGCPAVALRGKNVLGAAIGHCIGAVDRLVCCQEIDLSRIGCIDASRNGMTGLLAAALDGRIKAVAGWAPCATMRSVSRNGGMASYPYSIFGQLKFDDSDGNDMWFNHASIVLAAGVPAAFHYRADDIVAANGIDGMLDTLRRASFSINPDGDAYSAFAVAKNGGSEVDCFAFSSISWLNRKFADGGADKMVRLPRNAAENARTHSISKSVSPVRKLGDIPSKGERKRWLYADCRRGGDGIFEIRSAFEGEKGEEAAKMLYMLGDSAVVRSAEDILLAVSAECRRTGRPVSARAYGSAVIALAHAVATEPGLFASIEKVDAPPSWTDSVRAGGTLPYADVVHGALRECDWTDLWNDFCKKTGRREK